MYGHALLIGTGHPRARQTSTDCPASGGRMARSRCSARAARSPDVRWRCRLTQSTANAGEEAHPDCHHIYGRRSSQLHANLPPNLRASASCAPAGHRPSSAAPRARCPASAMLTARHPPLRSISAAWSGRPRWREPRSTADLHRAQANNNNICRWTP